MAFRIDNIRSKARHLAYNSDVGGVFNPFRKLGRSKTGMTAVSTRELSNAGQTATDGHEHDLDRIHTENCVASSAEIKRTEALGDDPRVKHSATMPASSPTDPSPKSTWTNGDKKDVDRKETDMTGNTLTSNESDKPRKRGVFKKLFGGKEEKSEDPEMQRTDTSESKPKKHFTVMEQVKTVILGSWINVLLICSPVGIAIHYANLNPYADFVINFIAIMPLAGILSYSTEEIALRVGETLGGLLNASFG